MAIHQSGMIMYFYNMNQINRMKIKKKEFTSTITISPCPEFSIENVVYPFIPQMMSQKISLYIANVKDLSFKSICADWNNYKLILFNIF